MGLVSQVKNPGIFKMKTSPQWLNGGDGGGGCVCAWIFSRLFAPDSLPSRGCKGSVYFFTAGGEAFLCFSSAPALVSDCLAFGEAFYCRRKRRTWKKQGVSRWSSVTL